MKIALIDKRPESYTSFFRTHGVFGMLAREHDIELLTDTAWTWPKLMRADLVVISRPATQIDDSIASCCAELGTPCLFDFDDNYLELPVWLPYVNELRSRETGERIETLLRHADGVLFSTQALARAMGRNTNVCVVPNAWNDRIFDFSAIHNSRKIISWRGSSQHEEDFIRYLPAMERTANRNPSFEWWFWGSPPWQVAKLRASSIHMPWEQNLFKYTLTFLHSKPWVHIIPLVPCPFNECKSNISWMEATAAGALVVAPDYEEFRKPGVFNYATDETAVADFELKLQEALECSDGEAANRIRASRQYIREHLLLSTVNQARLRFIEQSVYSYQRKPLWVSFDRKEAVS